MPMPEMGRKVGILALQGNVGMHADILHNIGLKPVLVREHSELSGLDGLILPGGESTTICRLISPELREGIQKMAREGRPILGTCAGLILLASRLTQQEEEPFLETLGLLDVRIRRNAFGPQIHSAFRQVQLTDGGQLSACFIRAPAITELGPSVQVLAAIVEDGSVCAVRQGNILGLTFHPEMGQIGHFHKLAFGGDE